MHEAENRGQTGDATLHFQENGDKRYITEVHRENPVRRAAFAEGLHRFTFNDEAEIRDYGISGRGNQ